MKCRCGHGEGDHPEGSCRRDTYRVGGLLVTEDCPCDVFRPVHGTGEKVEDLWPEINGREPEQGTKHDYGKPRPELLPAKTLLEVSAVLAFGAQKYAPDNWRKVPDLKNRYMGAALRHLLAYQAGESKDPETGYSHLAHAICSLMYVREDEVS